MGLDGLGMVIAGLVTVSAGHRLGWTCVGWDGMAMGMGGLAMRYAGLAMNWAGLAMGWQHWPMARHYIAGIAFVRALH
jgi:hypothetical protein